MVKKRDLIKKGLNSFHKATTESRITKVQLYLLIFSFLGLALGVIEYSMAESVQNSVTEIVKTAYNGNHFSFSEQFFGNFLINLLYILISFLCGISVLGYIVTYFIIFVKSLGITALASYFYSLIGFKGVEYCILFIFPISLLQIIAIFLACNEGNLMSKDIFSLLLKKENKAKFEIKLCFVRFGIIVLILLISSILYSLMFKPYMKIII